MPQNEIKLQPNCDNDSPSNTMKFREFLKIFKINPRCRNCQVDSIHGSLLDHFPNIQPLEPWKFGHLYQCSTCSRFWFLHENKRFIDRIPDKMMPLTHHWNKTPLTLNASTLEVLKGIGGVAEYYQNYIMVPCCVKKMSDEQQDKALVLISKQPPYFLCKPQMIHWADEIKEVTLSPFALPFDVRKASSEKEELSMGFAPTGVKDKTEIEYTLHCESHFFDYKGVKGEDIVLSGREKKWRKNVLPTPPQSYYFADWFDGCDQMLTGRRSTQS